MQNEVSGPVYGQVVQAHTIGTLHLHGGNVEYPPLTSWTDRPNLTDELRDLLHVQHDAAETLPYRLLGVKPPELTRVYVQQSLQQTVRTFTEYERKPPKGPVSIGEALATGNHLLITGEPGAGKSTLGQMYVGRLASEWLEPSSNPPLPEPVMPVRIPAKALADDLSWSELLANAVRDRRLNGPLKPELFAKRALGARWLVFVDGLDEIAETDRRERVIDAIVSRMRRGTDHRLVITTRPLPSDELQKLHGDNVESFTIEPFGPMELRDFASGWFRAQDPTRAAERAAEFVRQVHDGRLRELVRNPLLATIAAIANTLEPRRKLPHNRADLYHRFMSYLLNDDSSGRTTISELRRVHAGNTLRMKQIEWLHKHRRPLIEHLALQRLESERPLLDSAVKWIENDQGHDHVHLEDVVAVLADTGVFVQGEEGLRFLHHSFAEFLAARVRATAIPKDFPNLDDWVEQGTLAARETSVLFTFVLWSRRGYSLTPVLERLLDGGRKHALLAGRLVAEDVVITETLAYRVVARLVKVILANGTSAAPWAGARDIGRVLAGLGNDSIVHALVPRLTELRDNAELPPVVRIGCAVALGHIDAPEAAVEWLREFADVRNTNSLSAIAKGLAEILPNGAVQAEELVRRLTASTNSYYLRMMAIDILMFGLDRRAAASAEVRDLVLRMRRDPSIRLGTPHVPHSGAPPDTDPLGWNYLIRQALSCGCASEAVWAGEQVLAQSTVTPEEFSDAAGVLLDQRGATAVETVVSRARSLTLEHVLLAAEWLPGVDVTTMVALAKEVAFHPAVTDDQFVRACHVLAPYATVEVPSRRWTLDGSQLMRLVRLDPVRPQRELVRRALTAGSPSPREFRKVVASALVTADFADEVHEVALSASPGLRAAAAAELHIAGYPALSADLIDHLVTDPLDAPSALVCLEGMISKEIPAQAQRLFDLTLTAAWHHEPAIARRLAVILHRVGRVSQAEKMAVAAFERSLGGNDMVECAGTLLDVSGSRHANRIVRKLNESGLSVGLRMDVADLFTDEGLLDQAISVWHDVVRLHGDLVDKGVDAASRLVKVGRRPRAINTAQKALAGDPLTASARANLRALIAWLKAMAPE